MRIFKNDIICFRAPFITIKRVPLGTRGTGSRSALQLGCGEGRRGSVNVVKAAKPCTLNVRIISQKSRFEQRLWDTHTSCSEASSGQA